jgi:DNA invertase Pin-like site-specific DNA recombinase
MKVGYMRQAGVDHKKTDTQQAVLQQAGCETIYADDAASKGAKLVVALNNLNSGDTFIVTKLDRLGKPIKGVVDLLNALASRSITFVAIEDAVDTSTTEGGHLIHVLARLALMSKALVNERTKISLAAAKTKGRTGGRPIALSQDKLAEAKKMIEGGMPVRAVAKIIGSSQATLYRLLGAKQVV